MTRLALSLGLRASGAFRPEEEIVNDDRNAQVVDGLLYHGVPVTRGVLLTWDVPEGSGWRAGVDAALASVTGTPVPVKPDTRPEFAPGVAPWKPDGLDQPTGAMPFPSFPSVPEEA